MNLESLTVREMLQLPILEEAVLIGGEQGLDRIVRYIDIMEVPDLKGWLREGEVLLTTGYAVRDDPGLLTNVVEQLAKGNGAALGIKSGRYLPQIPQTAIDLCNEYRLPILLIPQAIPYIDITETIMEQILDRQIVILKKSEEVYKDLMHMVLHNSGIQAMADEVAKLLHCPIWVLSNRCGVHISSPAGMPALSDSKTAEWGIEVDHQYVGKLIVGKELLSESEKVYVEQARQIFSLELMRRKIAIDTEMRIRGNFFKELLIGTSYSKQQIEDKGRELGLHPGWIWEVLMIEAEPPLLDEASPFLTELNQWLQHDIKCQQGYVWSHVHYAGEYLLVLLAVEPEAELHKKKLISKTEQLELQHLAAPFLSNWKGIRAGIGDKYPLCEVYRSYSEAKNAIQIGRKLARNRTVFTYNEVEIIQLLADSYEQTPLDATIAKKIGHIVNYDKQYGTDFVLTLYYYLATEGSLIKTANQLYVHRNSVKYRMDKMKELFQLELNNPLHRFMYYISTALYLVKKGE